MWLKIDGGDGESLGTETVLRSSNHQLSLDWAVRCGLRTSKDVVALAFGGASYTCWTHHTHQTSGVSGCAGRWWHVSTGLIMSKAEHDEGYRPRRSKREQRAAEAERHPQTGPVFFPATILRCFRGKLAGTCWRRRMWQSADHDPRGGQSGDSMTAEGPVRVDSMPRTSGLLHLGTCGQGGTSVWQALHCFGVRPFSLLAMRPRIVSRAGMALGADCAEGRRCSGLRHTTQFGRGSSVECLIQGMVSTTIA